MTDIAAIDARHVRVEDEDGVFCEECLASDWPCDTRQVLDALKDMTADRDSWEIECEQARDMALAQKACADAAEAREAKVRSLVDQQAEDEGLWFFARTAPEAYLQQELRRLHLAIEDAFGAAIEDEALPTPEQLARAPDDVYTFIGDVLASGAFRHRFPHPDDETRCAACRLKARAVAILVALRDEP